MAIDYAKLAAQAAEIEDQTEVVVFEGFDRRLAKAGPVVARFVEYVEMGMQPQREYQGKAKPDADDIWLSFDLLGKDYLYETGEEGKPKEQRCDRISVRIKKSLGGKAAFKKLFDKMVYSRENIKHMAQMLGEAFSLTIVHGEGKKKAGQDKPPVYANMRDKGEWFIRAPRIEDPVSGEIKDISGLVPQAINPIRIFVWELASKETWDSLFIDGFREVKDAEGNVVEQKSKNWMQETLLGATNFSGSPLEAVLTNLGTLGLPETNGDPLASASVTTVATGVTTPTSASTKVATTDVSAQPVATSSVQSQIALPEGMDLEQYQAFLKFQQAQGAASAATTPVATPAVQSTTPPASPAAATKPRGRPAGAKNKDKAAAASSTVADTQSPVLPDTVSSTAPTTKAPSVEDALASIGL